MPQPPEPQLAYLGFQLVAPSRRLSPYVRAYWSFRRETPLRAVHEEYMHPRGGFGIVFNFGDTVRLDAEPIAEPVFMDGTITVSRKLGFFGQVELMGVSFHEGGAYPFIGVPLHELRNETTLLDVMHRPALLELYARMQETASIAARLRMLEEWLLSRLELGIDRDALIPASLARIRAKREPLSIPELASEFAIGQRQLERLYARQVGISPKHYARLLRVETARLALKQANEQSTTSLGTELGFYDQSHFIREFSAVVGMTPYAYAKRSQKQAEANKL